MLPIVLMERKSHKFRLTFPPWQQLRFEVQIGPQLGPILRIENLAERRHNLSILFETRWVRQSPLNIENKLNFYLNF